MKRTKEETVIATENEQGHERVDNEMIEGAKMEIIPILPISAARKRARITYVEEKRQLPRFQYEPLKALDTRNTNSNSNTSVEVRICSTLINTKNEALKKRCLWGWKTYSSDSDLVCILVHLGIIPYPTAVSAKNPYPLPYKELIVTLEIIDAVKSPAERITLPSHEYNGIRSRFWEAYRDNRISVKNVRANAEKSMPGKAISIVPYQLPKLMVMPTVSISSISRSMAMRCCFDASNNPALVYSLFIVADRKTPKRLSKEVLYLEDGNNMRYEISRIDKKQRAAAVATVPEDEKKKGLYVRFGAVKNEVIVNERQHVKASASTMAAVPLREQYLSDCIVVKWSAFKWSPVGLTLGSNHYKLKRISFKSKKIADALPPPSDANNKT